VPPFAQEAREKGWPPPRVVGHEGVSARFRRYVLTAGYNGIINTRQFQAGRQAGAGVRWPVDYVYPDTTYSESLSLTVGGERFELRHDRGQTDDQTWVWVPGRSILCPGDFFEWSAPNAGNPQKVQRYPLEWALALRKMAALGAEIMLPGHGAVIMGKERVRQALLDTSEYLLSLHDQTVALMNEGATLGDIVATVRPPAHLQDRPYLQPLYDEPEFIVRNIWRLYGGWYDGVPSHLKPAPLADLGREVARLAGGVSRLVERAAQLLEAGDLALASHLADWATAAEPGNPQAHRLRSRVFSQRAAESPTAMTRGIFRAAAAESEAAAQTLEELAGRE
jgi:glyoxylase-like metal-dependent hydrolase (beta-lactamase superfamily II)